VVTNAYSVIHNADPEKYQSGEILEILPPDLKTSEESKPNSAVTHTERTIDFGFFEMHDFFM
jgi:hypothetical protein